MHDKKIISILLFFSFFISYSQNNWKENPDSQIAKYELATNYLRQNDTINAIRNFYFSYKYGENTILGKNVKKELDLLVESERKKLLKNIQGKWKLKKEGSNWGYKIVDSLSKNETILIITPDSLHFYTKNKETNKLDKLKSEKINFTTNCYCCENILFYFCFSDNQIWMIKPNKDNTILHFKNDGYFNNDGMRVQRSCGNIEKYYTKIAI